MASQDENKGSGSDGSWFLEAVGAVAPAPTPSEAVAALEADNTVPDIAPVEEAIEHTVTFSSFDGDTSTSTSTFESPRGPLPATEDPTREMAVIAAANMMTNDDGDDLNPILKTRRPFRWPALAFGVFVVVVAALAAVWLPAALKQDALGVKQSYADASLDLRRELPTGQLALDTITDPSSTPGELLATIPMISQLDSASHALSVAAAEPLPTQLPFFPVQEITDLEALQDTAQINAAQGSDIARNIGHSYVYRTTIPLLLTTGDLPVSADVQTINALSVMLASSLVDDSSALSDLPAAEATADLKDLAHASVERFAIWQDEYLTALAEGDEETATVLISELDDLRSDLTTELNAALATMRVEIDVQIVELATDLDDYLVKLTR
jgi:hypothetical protein